MTHLRRPWLGLLILKDEMGFLQVWSRSLGKDSILFSWLDRWINWVGVDDLAIEVFKDQHQKTQQVNRSGGPCQE
jgi:hypothetical protein